MDFQASIVGMLGDGVSPVLGGAAAVLGAARTGPARQKRIQVPGIGINSTTSMDPSGIMK
jgi:hypothetical protein